MQTTTIKIQGMTCQGCVNSIKTVLEKLPDIIRIEISLDTAQAIVEHNPATTSIDQLKTAIEDAGFEVID
ncbi:heavy-metal-associated domain-containing protein [Nitrosomonas sp.]|uniref:heavy-metal-associated domain-containing protein n=1 Tax=Nitrosomonas sp. TaxID=42353 RepID=UPI001D1F4B72|nr:heavy metal-associated domain-containing protein [Nitrosomonas sp.]MCB1949691.1 heavy-metal-associated domain-containing protein [Nitrosomonas sp.]MCP5242163.1 heavy-metal-associated domain-containing protein [Burkholderiales bacterium]MDR4514725.1 cation transporter [Nitrosomonas sp.]